MNVLIIDDTGTIRSITQKTLQSYGYITHIISSSRNIKAFLNTFPLSLVILSTSLTKANSMDLCAHIRKNHPQTFILGIHSKGPWQNKVDLLEHGADDCINFPFPTQELVARIQALLRRPKNSQDITLNHGKISLKPFQKKVYYANSPIDLTRKEFMVLEYMLRNKDRIISRSELLDHVWDYTKIINSNTVDVHIQKIRKKMRNIEKTRNNSIIKDYSGDLSSIVEEKPYSKGQISPLHDTIIRTVHGIGYRLEGNIEKKAAERTVKSTTPPPEL